MGCVQRCPSRYPHVAALRLRFLRLRSGPPVIGRPAVPFFSSSFISPQNSPFRRRSDAGRCIMLWTGRYGRADTSEIYPLYGGRAVFGRGRRQNARMFLDPLSAAEGARWVQARLLRLRSGPCRLRPFDCARSTAPIRLRPFDCAQDSAQDCARSTLLRTLLRTGAEEAAKCENVFGSFVGGGGRKIGTGTSRLRLA